MNNPSINAEAFMSFVRLVDTGETVHADWAAEHAFEKNGAFYALDPSSSTSGASERGQQIAKSASDPTRAAQTPDFVRGQKIVRSLRQSAKSKGPSK
jgi:hypothetical protein